MAAMMTIEQLRDGLQKHPVRVVVEATGLHRNTISAIRNGRKNPKYEVILKLSEYLAAQETE
jgi:transcriptional regulator with XRE-family HTH domain